MEKRAKFDDLENNSNNPVSGLEKFDVDKSKKN